MFGVIILIIIVVLIIIYLTGLPFELGTGFTEMKNNARKGEYTSVNKEKIEEKNDEIKHIE